MGFLIGDYRYPYVESIRQVNGIPIYGGHFAYVVKLVNIRLWHSLNRG
jgi:hypothetical protein